MFQIPSTTAPPPTQAITHVWYLESLDEKIQRFKGEMSRLPLVPEYIKEKERNRVKGKGRRDEKQWGQGVKGNQVHKE